MFILIIFYIQHMQMKAVSFLRTRNLLQGSSKVLISSLFSLRLKPNNEKSEIAGIGVKKGYMWHSVEWTILIFKKTVKILRAHYFYNKKLEIEKNFKNHIQKIETVLKIWRMRNLTFEGKITIFETSTISKIIHLAPVTVLTNSTVTHLTKIHKKFIWSHKKKQKY